MGILLEDSLEIISLEGMKRMIMGQCIKFMVLVMTGMIIGILLDPIR